MKEKLFILAHSQNKANYLIHRMGLTPNDYTYVGDISDIQGKSGTLIAYGDFYIREDNSQIMQYASGANFTILNNE